MSSDDWKNRISIRALDGIDKLVLSLLYAALTVRIVSAVALAPTFTTVVANLPLLLGEGLVLFLALIRRPAVAVSPRIGDWLLALTASCMPLLVAPVSLEQALLPASISGGWMFVAFVFQIYAKLNLGRSFGLVAANRGLRLDGPYRWVRHPLYLGYLIMHVCFALRNPSPRNVLLYLAFYSLQIPRIAAEERLLMADPEYRAYMRHVRWKLIPFLY